MAVDLFSTGTISFVTRLHIRSANNDLVIAANGERSFSGGLSERKNIICWRINE